MKFRRRFALKHGIDLTPMIDIVFNLLIFFMLGSTIINIPQLKITLPKSSTSEISGNKEIIIITISKDNTVFVNGEELSETALQERLTLISKEENALERTVQIRADEEVSTKTLINVIDSVKNSGFSKLSIATSIAKQE